MNLLFKLHFLKYRKLRKEIRIWANYLEKNIFHDLDPYDIPQVTFRIQSDQKGLVFDLASKRLLDLPPSILLADFLKQHGIETLILSSLLEKNQIIDVLNYLIPLLLKANLTVFNHKFCTNIQIDPETKVLFIDYSYCKLMMTRLKPFDINELVNEVITTGSFYARKSDVQVKVEKKYEGFVNGDRDKLKRVLSNILNNAVKFSGRNTTVTIRLNQNIANKKLELTCTDQGSGIPKEQRAEIFNKFFQIKASKEPKEIQGYGLGLTFCKLVMDAHNESIQVDDSKTGGAVFKITFPLEAEG